MSGREPGDRRQPAGVAAPGADLVPVEGGRHVDRRSRERTEADYSSLFRVDSVSCIVDVKDISRSGARIAIRRGLVPRVGQLVEFSPMEREVLPATVVWITDAEIGLRFLDELRDESDVLHFDDLGAAYFRAVLKYQIAQGE